MQGWKNKRLWPAYCFLAGLLLVAAGRDILANDRPLYCRIGGEAFFPGLRTLWQDPDRPFYDPVLDSLRIHSLWRCVDYEAAFFAPIPFSPGKVPMSPDTTVVNQPPGSLHPGPRPGFRHWLGTDPEGYDVAAGLVGGARVAVLTGALAVLVSFGIGMMLGAVAGYWGDDRLRIRRGQLLLMGLGLPLAWFYAGLVRRFATEQSDSHWPGILLPALTFVFILLFFSFSGRLLLRRGALAQRVVFPMDMAVMRLSEVFTSMPGLLVIIAFAAMLRKYTDASPLWMMIALIGAFSWTGIARFVRAEMLRIRALDYVTAARGMGLGEWRILFAHALPNALRPVYVVLALGVAEAILLEAALSFLGYGGNNFDGATWGSLLQNARTSPGLWWLSAFPGLAISLSILALHAVGESVSEKEG